MSEMLYQVRLPVDIARMKEDLSMNGLGRYLRYFNMFMSRFRFYVEDKDLSFRLFYKLLFAGKVAFVADVAYEGLIVAEVTDEKKDPNGYVVEIDARAEGNWRRKGLKVGKDCVLLYNDMTHVPPILYLWAIANEVIDKEMLINQQDNMLAKPILVTGEGEEFDNAMNNAKNVLSHIAWLSTKANNKGNKGKNVMSEKGMEILNLQMNNAYKGAELWDSRKKYEELICDYLGYTTTKNEKRERMNTKEVVNENSVGITFYKSSVKCLEDAVKDIKNVFSKKARLEKILEEEKEDDKEDNMARTNSQDENR